MAPSGIDWSSGGVIRVGTFPSSGLSRLETVVLAADGAVDLGGLFSGTMTLGTSMLTAVGGEDAFLARVSTDGSVVMVPETLRRPVPEILRLPKRKERA